MERPERVIEQLLPVGCERSERFLRRIVARVHLHHGNPCFTARMRYPARAGLGKRSLAWPRFAEQYRLRFHRLEGLPRIQRRRQGEHEQNKVCQRSEQPGILLEDIVVPGNCVRVATGTTRE
jgi:hypothetical protein